MAWYYLGYGPIGPKRKLTVWQKKNKARDEYAAKILKEWRRK